MNSSELLLWNFLADPATEQSSSDCIQQPRGHFNGVKYVSSTTSNPFSSS